MRNDIEIGDDVVDIFKEDDENNFMKILASIIGFIVSMFFLYATNF